MTTTLPFEQWSAYAKMVDDGAKYFAEDMWVSDAMLPERIGDLKTRLSKIEAVLGRDSYAGVEYLRKLDHKAARNLRRRIACLETALAEYAPAIA